MLFPKRMVPNESAAMAKNGTTAVQSKLMTHGEFSISFPGGRLMPTTANHETNTPAVEEIASPTAPVQNMIWPHKLLKIMGYGYLKLRKVES
jgi:hypothetical protein